MKDELFQKAMHDLSKHTDSGRVAHYFFAIGLKDNSPLAGIAPLHDTLMWSSCCESDIVGEMLRGMADAIAAQGVSFVTGEGVREASDIGEGV